MSVGVKWGLLIGWAATLLFTMLAYSQRQLSPFDPQGILLHASTDPMFDETVVQALKRQGVTAASIVHISTEDACYCDTLAQPHQTQLLAKLSTVDYRAVTLDLNKVPSLEKLIPSIPALIVIDNDYQLRYLGPYANGYGCVTGDTLVEAISQYATKGIYPGAVINTEAKGCFCDA